MTAHALLHVLRQRGIELTSVGDRIRYRAPEGTLTPELKQALADRKPELLEIFSKEVQPVPARRTGRQIITDQLAGHECPDGCGPLELQDRAREVWYCPSCQLWVTEGRIH